MGLSMGWNTFSPTHTRKSLLWIHRPPCRLSGDQAELPYNSRFHNGSVEINIWMPDNSSLPIPKLSWNVPSSSNSAVGKILKEQWGEPKDWQPSSSTEVSAGCSVKGKQTAKDPRILSQLGYLCVLPALIEMSLHPSVSPLAVCCCPRAEGNLVTPFSLIQSLECKQRSFSGVSN